MRDGGDGGAPPEAESRFLSFAFASLRNTASLALALYYLQLAGNLTWTPLFFGLKHVSLKDWRERAGRRRWDEVFRERTRA